MLRESAWRLVWVSTRSSSHLIDSLRQKTLNEQHKCLHLCRPLPTGWIDRMQWGYFSGPVGEKIDQLATVEQVRCPNRGNLADAGAGHTGRQHGGRIGGHQPGVCLDRHYLAAAVQRQRLARFEQAVVIRGFAAVVRRSVTAPYGLLTALVTVCWPFSWFWPCRRRSGAAPDRPAG